jgi:hypothetical protein
LARRYNGQNNGQISLSVRQAASEIGCCLNHAADLLHELEEAGFIAATQRGAFSWKKRHATTWRLTWIGMRDSNALSGIAEPTKDFMRVRKQSAGAPGGTNGSSG